MTSVSKILRHRTERGFAFDPESAIFRQSPEVQTALPEEIKAKLIALEQQIYVGPNSSAAPDQCAHPVLAFFGLSTTEISPAVWQEWTNLGKMSTKAAAAKYLQLLTKFYPQIMNFIISIESSQKFSLKTGLRHLAAFVIQRCCKNFKAKKYLLILEQIEKSAHILQRFWRRLRRNKLLGELRLHAQLYNVNALADILTRGFSVISFSKDRPPEKTILRLFNAGQFYMAKSVVFVSKKDLSRVGSDVSYGVMICDIAEIRAGCDHFPKQEDGKVSLIKPIPALSFSIIASKAVIHCQMIDPIVYGKTRDWIVRKFPCLVETYLSQTDCSTRGRFKGFRICRPIKDLMRFSIKDDAELLAALLLKGLVIIEVFRGVEILKTIYLSWKHRRINIGRKPVFDVEFFGNKGFQIDDISEIRRGRILPKYDAAEGIIEPEKVFSIVAGEDTISMKLDSEKIRNKMVRLFIAFVMVYKGKIPKVVTTSKITPGIPRDNRTPTMSSPPQQQPPIQSSRFTLRNMLRFGKKE